MCTLCQNRKGDELVETSEAKTILRIRNITKVFPGVKALDNVSLDIREGEVLSLLGENGAGKSTLIKVLSGTYIPEEGTMELNGEMTGFRTPADAKNAGISVVHQELAYLPLLTIAENLYVRHYTEKTQGLIDWKAMREYAVEAMKCIGLALDPDKPIGECSVAECQQVEIARAVYENARILILDEPTSSLTERETESLMECIDGLRKKGVTVVFITHKIEEIMRIADRVVVLRDGHTVGERHVADVTKDDLITMMVGRKITDMYPEKTNHPSGELLRVEGIETNFLKGINFNVRKGEILGIYGLMGSGHLEVGKALFGCYPSMKGKVFMEGRELRMKSPEHCVQDGMAFIPSSRKTEGLVLVHSIRSNIMNPYYQTGKHGWKVNEKEEKEISEKWRETLKIKANDIEVLTDTLSGGNQQKVVLAKWLAVDPKVVILNDPTRGIDVGAKAEIYRILNELTERGISVIMITSEMPELLEMSDRVLVMHEGQQMALLEKEEMTQKNIITAAIGGNIYE